MTAQVAVLCFWAGETLCAIAASEVVRIGARHGEYPELGAILGLRADTRDRRTYAVELPAENCGVNVHGPIWFSTISREDLADVDHSMWTDELPIIGYAHVPEGTMALLETSRLINAVTVAQEGAHRSISYERPVQAAAADGRQSGDA